MAGSLALRGSQKRFALTGFGGRWFGLGLPRYRLSRCQFDRFDGKKLTKSSRPIGLKNPVYTDHTNTEAARLFQGEGLAFIALSIVSRMYFDGVTAAIFPPVSSLIVP